MEVERVYNKLVIEYGEPIATFGYIGFEDREFLLSLLQEVCDGPLEWNVAETPKGYVVSLYVLENQNQVARALLRFEETINTLHLRAILGLLFNQDPDSPIPLT